MNYKKLSVTFILFLMFTSFSWAKHSNETTLVLDARNSPDLPKHFHSTADSLPININSSGLMKLKISGGSQFSKSSFEKIMERLHTKKITVIDLRQESHGLLNGNAISWFGWRNATNSNLKPDQIEKVQSELLVDLNNLSIVSVANILKKSQDGGIEKSKIIEYAVHQVMSEQDYILSLGNQYKRIYVQDYHAPNNNEVNHFLTMVKELPKNQWIYFHCRGGSGRTTTFMLMFDMIKNAKEVSLQDILVRHIALGGKDFSNLPDKKHFKYKPAVERLNFIKQFYQYAHDNTDDFETSWTEWLKKKAEKA